MNTIRIMRKSATGLLGSSLMCAAAAWAADAPEKAVRFAPFVWSDGAPRDCPFPRSWQLTGLRFLGRCSDYKVADTWYPTWAGDGNLYSPLTVRGTAMRKESKI